MSQEYQIAVRNWDMSKGHRSHPENAPSDHIKKKLWMRIGEIIVIIAIMIITAYNLLNKLGIAKSMLEKNN